MGEALPERYRNVQPPLKFTEEVGALSRDVRLDFREVADWDVPEEVVITVAPVGAFVDKEQNPNQPTTPEEIAAAFVASVEAGAAGIHVHARNEAGRPSAEARHFRLIVDPVRKKFGKNVVIDGGCMTGKTFQETITPITEGIYDVGIVNPTTGLLGRTIRGMLPGTMVAQAEYYREHGVRPMIDIHDASSIGNAKRYLIDTGVVPRPCMWHLLPGIPGTFHMESPRAMVKGLLYLVESIREIDDHPFILVSEAGRPSTYIMALAMLLGLNVRVGMEDVVYKYPHKKQMVKSNVELVQNAVQVAEALGRRPATGLEYRRMIGMG
ncbi:MAG: 3-keto-5-aminohexanoate cleavage protein [Nitrososphaerota archaeon]|nr:3-keto-5-aminohexanoate cleavage protein [Nitrososphaerota archaeon]MDG6939449.1 3-keto-5-aminohexanoate cleavage protein [Nitrososphaerota archaeon]